MDEKKQSISEKPRKVRVFVSSTFKDMQEERDHLVKHVFPELKRRCKKRQIEFIDIDLRWGITEDQAEQGEVLPICFAEIDKCRPYFIGILGDRYGYVPSHYNLELLTKYPWLKEDLHRSITELEISYAVFHIQDMKDRSFFYIKTQNFAEKNRRVDKVVPRREEPEVENRLDRLKERIIEQCKNHERYSSPEELGRKVLETLWSAIDREFPEQPPLDIWTTRQIENDTFAEYKSRHFNGREKYLSLLDTQVEYSSVPLLLAGEHGSGKSAIISRWVLQYRENNPKKFIFTHFIGSTSDSSDYSMIIDRIVREIKIRYDMDGEVPVSLEEKIKELPVWLAKAASREHMIIVLDGLDRLDNKDNSLDLTWLPAYFPPGITLITSTANGKVAKVVKNRGWSVVQVRDLSRDERQTFVIDYLKTFGRSLNETHISQIVSCRQTGNPLYLRLLLDELKVFGIYEKLGERITYYLKSKNIPELYNRIFLRLENDYDKNYLKLVQRSMSYLYASKNGLYESELLELLGPRGKSLPIAYWSPLYLSIQELLIDHSGRLSIAHDTLRKAIQQRYIRTPENRHNVHRKLARYFYGKPIERKFAELPYQLWKALEWKTLKEVITDPEIFTRLHSSDDRDLVGYWSKIDKRYDLVEEYKKSIVPYEQQDTAEDLCLLANLDTWIGKFCINSARYDGAELFFKKSLVIRERVLGEYHTDTASSLNSLAVIYLELGKLDQAEPLIDRAIGIAGKLNGKNSKDYAYYLTSKAMLIKNRGDFENAHQIFLQALSIIETASGKDHPDTATALNNLACLQANWEKYSDAERLFRQALEIAERTQGLEHPDTAQSYNNLAIVLLETNKVDEALPLVLKGLQIRKKIFGREHASTAASLNSLASIYFKLGEKEKAIELLQEVLKIRETKLGKTSPDTIHSIFALAEAYNAINNIEMAEKLHKEAKDLREQIGNFNSIDMASSSHSYADILYRQGRFDEASKLYEQAYQIRIKLLGELNVDTAKSANGLAMALFYLQKFEEASTLLKRLFGINEIVLDHDAEEIFDCTYALGYVLAVEGKYDESIRLLKNALETSENRLGKTHKTTDMILDTLAKVYELKFG